MPAARRKFENAESLAVGTRNVGSNPTGAATPIDAPGPWIGFAVACDANIDDFARGHAGAAAEIAWSLHTDHCNPGSLLCRLLAKSIQVF